MRGFNEPNGGSADPGVAARKVVLVEDNDSMRLTLEWLLKSLHCVVSSFARAEPAVSTVVGDPARADIVLCETHMPGLSGWQLVDAIRAEVGPWPPIVLMSGDASRQPASSCYRPDAFLAQPFGLAALLEALREADARSTLNASQQPPWTNEVSPERSRPVTSPPPAGAFHDRLSEEDVRRMIAEEARARTKRERALWARWCRQQTSLGRKPR